MNLPTLFISHGSPTFALQPGRLGPALAELGRRLPRPRAVLVISPHWMTPGLEASSAARPATIHDFGGFPEVLYTLEYPAPGAPEVAAEVVAALNRAGFPGRANAGRGLDHGAWVPLMHLYPAADVPVLQLSLPMTHAFPVLLGLGRALAPLRESGVLILASGSVTHNLYDVAPPPAAEAPYARAFMDWLATAIAAGDLAALEDYRRRAPHAQRAHPSDEHLLPLFIAIGAAGDDWTRSVRLDAGIDLAAIGMDSYAFAVNAEWQPALQASAAAALA